MGDEISEGIHLVYVTVGQKAEGLLLAKTVVQEGLAACANVIENVVSVYQWQGALQEDSECIVVLKTRSDRVTALSERLVSLHSYDCPCVVAWPLAQGNLQFLSWVKDQTR